MHTDPRNTASLEEVSVLALANNRIMVGLRTFQPALLCIIWRDIITYMFRGSTNIKPSFIISVMSLGHQSRLQQTTFINIFSLLLLFRENKS